MRCKSAGCKQYFFNRTKVISLLSANSIANTRFLILLQAPTIAELMESRIEEARGKHWTAPKVKAVSFS